MDLLFKIRHDETSLPGLLIKFAHVNDHAVLDQSFIRDKEGLAASMRVRGHRRFIYQRMCSK